MALALLDTLLDTLRIIPFLFAAYLAIEFIEHRASDRLVAAVSRVDRFGPLSGPITWLLPHFSVVAAKLYAGRIISYGTLAALFIATSDEALPILLADPASYGYIWRLLAIKLALSVAVGFAIDALFKHEKPSGDSHEAHDHMHEGCGHGECEHGIFLPAIKHTATGALFVLAVLAAVNVAVALVGEDAIKTLFVQSLLLQPLIAALVGLIPSCASSIILAELFVQGAISFGSLVTGLTVTTGVAYVVLIRSGRGYKRGLVLMGIIIIVALLCGYVIQLLV